jgi:hypothetical protein
MAFSSVALLGGAAYLDVPQVRLLQTGSFKDEPAVDWSRKGAEGARHVYDYFAALSTLAGGLGGDGREVWTDTTGGHRITLVTRRSADGARRYVAVVNLSHVGLANYPLGVEPARSYRVVLNADANVYGGSGVLEKRLGSGILAADGPAMGGKDASVTIPYLGPYATVVLQRQ